MAIPRSSSGGTRKVTGQTHLYMEIAGGHRGEFWPEDLIVIKDEAHFLCDRAEPERTDPDDPDIQSLLAHIEAHGVPGEPIFWQEPPDANGKVKTYMVDGRRRLVCWELRNQRLKAEGLTPEKFGGLIRNDLSPTQLRELVAAANKPGKPPSLAQKMRQARGLVDEYRREAKLLGRKMPSDSVFHERAATHFRGADGQTVARWLQVPRFTLEAQALVLQERAPLEVVDDLAQMSPEQQVEAVNLALKAEDPKLAKLAVETFARNLTRPKAEPASDTETSGTEGGTEGGEPAPKRTSRSAKEWSALRTVVEAHSCDPDDQVTQAVRSTTQNILQWQRCDLDLPGLLAALGYPVAEKEQRDEPVPVSVRTNEEKAAYDAKVLAILQENAGRMAAQEIGALAGGLPDQVRRSLTRLVEAGYVECEGQASATRYWAMEGATLTPKERPEPVAASTKTREDRVVYDAKVLEVLRSHGGQMSSQEIGEAAGGLPDQVRRSLARLVEAQRVDRDGKGMGMRYWAVDAPTSASPLRPAAPNLQTSKGRDAFDARVLGVLQELEEATAEQIYQKLGGALRSAVVSLGRSVAAHKVSLHEGRYRLVSVDTPSVQDAAQEYDAIVLGCLEKLGGQSVKAKVLREAADHVLQQKNLPERSRNAFLSAATRLKEAGKITSNGINNGTTYSLAAPPERTVVLDDRGRCR